MTYVVVAHKGDRRTVIASGPTAASVASRAERAVLSGLTVSFHTVKGE